VESHNGCVVPFVAVEGPDFPDLDGAHARHSYIGDCGQGNEYLFELFRQRAIEVSEDGEVRLVEEEWFM